MMKNGNLYSCEAEGCDRTEFVTREDLGFDEGPKGWVSIMCNQPRDYGWTFREPLYSTASFGPRDFCSIDCAQKTLRDITPKADV